MGYGILVLGLLPVCLAAQPVGAGNLLVNGSFEVGVGSAPSGAFVFARCSADNTVCITGWQVTGDDVDYIGSYWQAQEGNRSVELAGAGSGGLSQTFATTPGAVYMVLFWLSGNPDRPGVRTLAVEAAGQAGIFTFDPSGFSHSSMGWVRRVWIFRALAGSTALAFRTTDRDFGPVIDDVRVEALACPVCAACPPGSLVMETWVDRREIHCPAGRCVGTGVETTWVPRGEVEVYRNGLRQVSGAHYTEAPAEYFPGASFGKRRFTFPQPFASGEVLELRYPVPRGARYVIMGLDPGSFPGQIP